MKWELVDMGSLNGTLLNSKSINHPDTGSRHWGDPMNLTNGDVITLGTTSKIIVSVSYGLVFFITIDHRCKACLNLYA
jgi:protein phosphatase